jgi:hypothetical protein
MPHAYDGTGLVDLLPVRARRNTAGYDAASYNPFRIEITPAGAVHEAIRLHEEPARNATLWSQMPPYFWSAAVVRPAPGATVLATNPAVQDRFGKLPLITYQYAGNGKVLFVGTDSTWLWRQNVGDRFFYKFWGQAIRFVASRDESGGKKSWIEVRPLRVRAGESVEMELMAVGPDGTPSTQPSQTVTIVDPTGQPHSVTMEPSGNAGRYLGRFLPALEGDHNIMWQADGDESARATLHVESADEELRRPAVDRPALELLASQSGGQLVELQNIDQIPELLEGETRSIPLHREETVWDNWFTAVLLAFIYCIDVGIRRFAGLS